MSKRKIITAFLVVLVASVALGYSAFYLVDYIKNSDNNEADIEYLYPQAEKDLGISVEYTAETLTKKAKGEALTTEEHELIYYYSIQEDGYGIAVTRYCENDGGMGKASRRIWETADGGEFWNVLRSEFFSVGINNFAYIDNVLIESTFGNTAMKGYFNVSHDRGHRFESIPYEEVFRYDGTAYAVKLDESAERKTVTYQWFDFETQEAISIIEYDLNLKPVKEIKG